MTRPGVRALRRDRRGVTAVEFAMVAPVMMLMIMGFIELAFQTMINGQVNGVLAKAARMSTTGQIAGDTVDTYVRTQLSGLYKGSTVTIDKSSYASFTGVGTAEPITSDTAPYNVYNSTDCYQDVNGNGRWDADQGKTGTGGPDDILSYKVTFSYPRLFGYVVNIVGWDPRATVSATSTMRNEPFQAVATSSIVTRCS